MTRGVKPCATHLELLLLEDRGRKNRGIKVIFRDIASSRTAWLQPDSPCCSTPMPELYLSCLGSNPYAELFYFNSALDNYIEIGLFLQDHLRKLPC